MNSEEQKTRVLDPEVRKARLSEMVRKLKMTKEERFEAFAVRVAQEMMRIKKDRLMPHGIPKYVRCYDNGGKTTDRYTVVYTGRIPGKRAGNCYYCHMSEHPCSPQGVGIFAESTFMIDRPKYGHLGKKINFRDLPINCQGLAIADYLNLWNLHTCVRGEDLS